MRALLVASLLSLTVLSGCLAGQEDGLADGSTTAGYNSNQVGVDSPVPGLLASHPSHGFLTQGTIPMTEDGRTRVVNDDGTVSWFRPAGESWQGRTPGSMEPVANVNTTQGHGIAVFGPLAFYGGDGQTQPPLIIVDISNPTNPVEVGRHDDVPVRDADTILYPDGRLVVISTGGQANQFATDVTDPANPELLAEFETPRGNHNIAVVPGTPIVYNSGNSTGVDIVDYSDPSNPVVAGVFDNGHGCHDITFYIDRDEEKYRAYCAASSGDRSQIWDIGNPLIPVMVTDISFPGVEQGMPFVGDGESPDSGVVSPGSIDHLLMVNHDASVLIMGDETGGGGVNGCDAYFEDGGGAYSGPHGNVWFYDLSDEQNPVLLSHISPESADEGAEGQPGNPAGSCTSHFGRLVEDTDFLVIGFYTAGVILIDFTDPANPLIADRVIQGGSVWDVWYQDGWLYTGDTGRGMDILQLVEA